MAILSADELREQVETDLSDDGLGRLIDAAEAEIVARFGKADERTEELRGGTIEIFPAGRVGTVTKVVERRSPQDPHPVTLTEDDYHLSPGSWLTRLHTGPNKPLSRGWAPVVTVTYTPVDDSKVREGVLIDLVRLEIMHTGAQAVQSGEVSVTASEYRMERMAILGRLETGLGIAL